MQIERIDFDESTHTLAYACKHVLASLIQVIPIHTYILDSGWNINMRYILHIFIYNVSPGKNELKLVEGIIIFFVKDYLHECKKRKK